LQINNNLLGYSHVPDIAPAVIEFPDDVDEGVAGELLGVDGAVLAVAQDLIDRVQSLQQVKLKALALQVCHYPHLVSLQLY